PQSPGLQEMPAFGGSPGGLVGARPRESVPRKIPIVSTTTAACPRYAPLYPRAANGASAARYQGGILIGPSTPLRSDDARGPFSVKAFLSVFDLAWTEELGLKGR